MVVRDILCKSAVAFGVAALLVLLAAPAQAMRLDRLIAPATACPNQGSLDAPAKTQERAMHCMTNFARRRAGLSGYSRSAALDWSAGEKSRDIIRCDSFSHEACGRPFTFWMKRAGYTLAPCWRAAENIAWGTGSLGTVRSVFRSWIHSPGHRANILGDYRQLGVGLRVGTLEGHPDVHVWAQHFGIHC